MRSKFEQFKKIYIFFIDLLILIVPTILFEYVWSRNINDLLYVDFKNKGNWLVILCYLFLLFIMMYALRGLRIGYYKIASLIISQILALFCTHIIMTIQIILMVGKVATIRRIVLCMSLLFLINSIATMIITILFTKT